jgi:hypothetical protein
MVLPKHASFVFFYVAVRRKPHFELGSIVGHGFGNNFSRKFFVVLFCFYSAAWQEDQLRVEDIFNVKFLKVQIPKYINKPTAHFEVLLNNRRAN